MGVGFATNGFASLATLKEMISFLSDLEEIGKKGLKIGLEDVWWGGYYPVDTSERVNEMARELKGNDGAMVAFAYSKLAGCIKENRNCGECPLKLNCPAGLKEPWLLDVD